MKYILTIMVLISTLFAQNLIKPTHIYKLSSGLGTDVLYNEGKLYASTDTGTVDIFDTTTKKLVSNIKLSKIKDFMGDEIDSKIFSIDLLGNDFLVLSQDTGGYSRIHIYNNSKSNLVISRNDRLNIIKAKFIDKENIVIALISNDIMSYNIKTKKINWDTQPSGSKFSNFAINSNRDKVVVADESGDVHVLSTKDGKILNTLTGENVDNIFGIDFKQNIVITGGQDRRIGIYNLGTSNKYHKSSSFFVYGVGLSPSGKIGAYSCDVDNNIELFSTLNEDILGKFEGNKKVVNSIYFINEKQFFVNSAEKEVRYFKIK